MALSDEKITLAGEDWVIPVLAPKQNRVIVPAMMKLADREHQYPVLLDIVYAALTRACPDLTREQFEDTPILTSELFAALPVVQRQAGVTRAAAKE